MSLDYFLTNQMKSIGVLMIGVAGCLLGGMIGSLTYPGFGAVPRLPNEDKCNL